MKRLLLALGVAVLLLETSGLAEMLRPEPCPLNESSTQHESCSTTCVRCACCAQPVMQDASAPTASAIAPPSRSPRIVVRAVQDPQVRDITHVPKTRAC